MDTPVYGSYWCSIKNDSNRAKISSNVARIEQFYEIPSAEAIPKSVNFAQLEGMFHQVVLETQSHLVLNCS